MLVTNPNSVKIYNLSAGKSLPEVSCMDIKKSVLLFVIFHCDNCSQIIFVA